MNRLLHRRKTEGTGSQWVESSATPSPQSKQGRWKKNKKATEVEEPQLAPALTLPSSDNFRTSLIMPNLSARFSMLREQDDPRSKLGKASDDSVLQPRRQSRMMDFGFQPQGLSDIAEVASIKSSIRPPFLAQHDSFVSTEGYGTDDDSTPNGSIMSRARAGEGNVLFGGRQKVYRIPTSTSARNVAKVVYDDDVNLSAYQRHRQQERDEKDSKAQGFGDEEEKENQVTGGASPDVGIDTTMMRQDPYAKLESQTRSRTDVSDSPKTLAHRRQQSRKALETVVPTALQPQESAAQLPSRETTQISSTVTSPKISGARQGPPQLERSLTKRRLYEQGLDQHMYDQQASNLTRLNSIQRQRTVTGGAKSPPSLLHAKSLGNLQERSYQPYAVRPQSPTVVHPLTTFGSIRKPNSNGSSPVPSGPQSPTFPPLNEYDEYGVLSSALQPGDRGKATAMGAFNKPKQQFDEQQYLQRQLQLQQALQAQQAAQSRQAIPQPQNAQTSRNAPTPEPRASLSRKNSVEDSAQSTRLARFDSARQSATARAYQRSRSRSSPAKADPTAAKAFSVFQNAAAQNRETHSPGSSPQLRQDESPGSTPQIPDTHRTFFGDISASDDDEDEELDMYGGGYHANGYPMASANGRFTPSTLPSVSEHPALRSQESTFAEIQEEEEEEDLPSVQPPRPSASARSLQTDVTIRAHHVQDNNSNSISSADSNDEALGGLVHQHLRNTSNQSSIAASAAPRDTSASDARHSRNISKQSSIYPDIHPKDNSVPSLTDNTSRTTRNTYSSENRIDSSYTNSNPWDLDDFDSGYYYGETDNTSRSPTSFADSTKPYSQPQSQQYSQSRVSAPSAADAQEAKETQPAPWQTEIKPNHSRDPSTATQQEREAFANELASRQRAIQENLRSIVEVESRGASPAPSGAGALKAFGILKAKSSRESMKRQDPPSKAMKMLGLAAGGANVPRAQDQYSMPEETGRTQFAAADGRGPLSNGRSVQSHMQRPRGDSEASSIVPTRPNRSPPQNARRESQTRSRSNSMTSTGRSQSRAGRYREEPAAGYAETAMRSASRGPSEHSPAMSNQFSPRPSPEVHQYQSSPVEQQARFRSNSKPNPNGYFDNRGYHPSQQSSNAPQPSTLPSLSSTTYKPAVSQSHRPPPIASPYSANPTPPMSMASTPVSHAFSAPTTPALPPLGKPTGNILRKKTVSKFEISEPTLISSTSNVDTIDLPTGASLKNGMNEVPPTPPVNPRRRRTPKLFGISSRSASAGEQPASRYANPGSPPPPRALASFDRVLSPEPMSEGNTAKPLLHQQQSFQSFRSDSRAPSRTMRSQDGFETTAYPLAPAGHVVTDGGMF